MENEELEEKGKASLNSLVFCRLKGCIAGKGLSSHRFVENSRSASHFEGRDLACLLRCPRPCLVSFFVFRFFASFVRGRGACRLILVPPICADLAPCNNPGRACEVRCSFGHDASCRGSLLRASSVSSPHRACPLACPTSSDRVLRFVGHFHLFHRFCVMRLCAIVVVVCLAAAAASTQQTVPLKLARLATSACASTFKCKDCDSVTGYCVWNGNRDTCKPVRVPFVLERLARRACCEIGVVRDRGARPWPPVSCYLAFRSSSAVQ